jgi:hypothetical protein
MTGVENLRHGSLLNNQETLLKTVRGGLETEQRGKSQNKKGHQGINKGRG